LFLKVLRFDQRWHDLHFSGSSNLGSLKQSGVECVSNANPLPAVARAWSAGTMGAKRIRMRQLVAPHFAVLIPVQAGTREKIKRRAVRN
jgi:hypothetical protein